MAEDDAPVKAPEKEEKKKPAPKRVRKPKEKPAPKEEAPPPVVAAAESKEGAREAVVSAQRIVHFISRGNARAAIMLLKEGRVEAAQLPALFQAAIPLNNVVLLRAIVRAYGAMDVPCIQALGRPDLVGCVKGVL